MRYHKCDQFAADMLHVGDEILKETGVVVNFVPAQVYSMVKTIMRAGKLEMEHEELKGFLMARYDFVNDEEYTAYERVLNRICKRRLRAAA